MKTFFSYLSAIIIVCMTSCSKGGSDDGGSLASVTTGSIVSVTHNSATANGTVSSEGSSPVFARGVCWNTLPDPNLGNDNNNSGNGTGNYTVTMSGLQPNKTYYARAYATNSKGTSYGANVIFTTTAAPEVSANSAGAYDIQTKTATLKAVSVQPAGTTVAHMGFCWSTTPDPNITNSNILTATTGVGNFSKDLPSTLQPNTTYYYKAFVQNNSTGVYYYSNEMSFKTTGYFGPSGGYVFYDKGEVTNGWRYLEAAPVELHYNIAFSPGAKWACQGTNLTLTNPEVGTGLENTNRIIATCGAANCAARLCANYQVGGLTGWFLPSREETFLLVRNLHPMGVLPPISTYWTSTELTADYAAAVYWNSPTSTFMSSSQFKDWYSTVRPVRRY